MNKMSMLRCNRMKVGCSIVMLSLVGLSTQALAQADDELAPLAPLARPKPKPKPVKAKPRPKVPSEDDLAPIMAIPKQGELWVKVSANQLGAVLFIDSKEVGVLPLPPQSLPVGEHSVLVQRLGHAAFVKKVVILGGKSVEVEAKLTPVAAVLSVTSDVPGAQVILNGRSIGTAPLNGVEVPPGPSELVVVKEGFVEESQRINLMAGKEYPVAIRFSQAQASRDRPEKARLTPDIDSAPGFTGVSAPAAPEPITSKWYFWAGIAAGVAAGVTTAVVIASQPPGLTQERVCGGSCAGTIWD